MTEMRILGWLWGTTIPFQCECIEVYYKIEIIQGIEGELTIIYGIKKFECKVIFASNRNFLV